MTDLQKVEWACGLAPGTLVASPPDNEQLVALVGQVALLRTTLSENGRAQLLPAGKFAARDGRPGPGKRWEVTDAQGLKLAADINATARQTPIVIDYEHQTIRAEANGRPAPAAGWIKSVEWLAGQGLFAEVDWTAAAKASIEAGEYRYISPVITSSDDGTVIGLLLAALVNHPAVIGMEPVTAALGAFAAEAFGEGLSSEQLRICQQCGVAPSASQRAQLEARAEALSALVDQGDENRARIARLMGLSAGSLTGDRG